MVSSQQAILDSPLLGNLGTRVSLAFAFSFKLILVAVASLSNIIHFIHEFLNLFPIQMLPNDSYFGRFLDSTTNRKFSKSRDRALLCQWDACRKQDEDNPCTVGWFGDRDAEVCYVYPPACRR